jgi:signal transduction histidine kinase
MIEAVVAGEDALVFGDGAFGDSVVIPPGTGKLRIDFTSPSLASPDRIGFQYRLEGFEDAWTSTGRVRSAFYTNIPPGRYRFHVVARGGGLRGSAADAVLPIVWQPHFYQTAWFYAALAVLAGLALFGALRIYARTTRARFALVLGERTRLAREMHDTVIQGCVGVSSLLEAARSLPPTAESQKLELLDRAAEQVRVTVNEAREAVWDLRHSDPSAERDRDAMVATLATFARQSEANSGIPVRVEVSGTPGLLGEREGRNLLLVAREAIRNAAAHAQPSVIAVTLAFEAGAARLEVADNGSGFVPDQQRTGGGANGHYGIVGMRERMKQSGGTLEMISSPGNGTRVVARLPLQASRKLR